MKTIQLSLFTLLWVLLAGCVSPHHSAQTNLINLTQAYLDSDSEEERKALFPRIEDAFVKLDEMGNDHFIVSDLPESLQIDLIDDIDWPGFGAKDPEWAIAYSCNGFFYITGFTCPVKRIKGSKEKGQEEYWTLGTPKDYFLFDGSSLPKEPVMKLTRIKKAPEPVTDKIPAGFFIIDRNSRIMQADELSREMITTLQTLANYQLESGEVVNGQASAVLAELKKRLQAVSLEGLCPVLSPTANRMDINFVCKDSTILVVAEFIALCSGNRLRLQDNGQLVILPSDDEFAPVYLQKQQSGGNLVLIDTKARKEKRILKFKAVVQGIIAERKTSPIGLKGNQKYFLPKLRKQLHHGYTPLIAVEKDPRIELYITLQTEHEYRNLFSCDSFARNVRHIALHDYKKYFGDTNPIGKTFDFTIESTSSRNGAVSYQLQEIKPTLVNN